MTNAKKKAVEYTATYIESESRVKDFELEKGPVEAYSKATRIECHERGGIL